MTHVSSRESVLLNEGWLRFNELRWGFVAERREYRAGQSTMRTVLYTDKRGRCVLPLLNPYLPIAFDPANARPPRLYSQWDSMASQLAEEMAARRSCGEIALEPGTSDARQWRWRGFSLGLAYTFHLDLPTDESSWDPSPRKQARKAEREGYRCESTQDFAAVERCLRDTERRQGFSHQLDAQGLAQLADLCGASFARAYLCRASDGTPAATRVVLWQSGATALDWVAGTQTAHMRSGATQLLLRHVLSDLHIAGATSFDFGGADIQAVAAAKQDWAASLVSYPTVRLHTFGSAVDAARLSARASTLGRRLISPVRRVKRMLRR